MTEEKQKTAVDSRVDRIGIGIHPKVELYPELIEGLMIQAVRRFERQVKIEEESELTLIDFEAEIDEESLESVGFLLAMAKAIMIANDIPPERLGKVIALLWESYMMWLLDVEGPYYIKKQLLS